MPWRQLVLFFFILFELVQISAIASPVHFVRVVAETFKSECLG